MKHPRIPNRETIDRYAAKMQALCLPMEHHIANLDELNAQLEADFQSSRLGVLSKIRADRQAAQQQPSL